MPLRILIEGWFDLSHSYCLVNIQQIIGLLSCNKDIVIYRKDLPYYNLNWKPISRITLTLKEESLINSLPKYNGSQEIDIIYRISYPYYLGLHENIPNIPIVVFYTNECGYFIVNSFKDIEIETYNNYSEFIENLKSSIQTRIDKKLLHFITPSKWSAEVFNKISIYPKIIFHGINPKHYYFLNNKKNLKKKYNLENKFVFLNVGAMTSNKGIKELLEAFFYLLKVNKNIHLILKGNDSLYMSSKFVKDILDRMGDNSKLIIENMTYISELYDFNQMNELYNTADVYVSPYLAEGFNLTVMEAITCGLPIICSKEPVHEYILNNDSIIYLNWSIIRFQDNFQNPHKYIDVNVSNLFECMKKSINNHKKLKKKAEKNWIEIGKKYSWQKISENLLNHLEYIVDH
jgi:glycosyltransferase involved in cell wall biosynthesis